MVTQYQLCHRSSVWFVEKSLPSWLRNLEEHRSYAALLWLLLLIQIHLIFHCKPKKSWVWRPHIVTSLQLTNYLLPLLDAKYNNGLPEHFDRKIIFMINNKYFAIYCMSPFISHFFYLKMKKKNLLLDFDNPVPYYARIAATSIYCSRENIWRSSLAAVKSNKRFTWGYEVFKYLMITTWVCKQD